MRCVAQCDSDGTERVSPSPPGSSTALSTAVWTAARTSRSKRENNAQARGRSVDAVRRVWEHLFPYACKEGDSSCGFAIHRAVNRAITVPSDGDKNSPGGADERRTCPAPEPRR